MNSLIENLTQARDQLDQIIRQIQGPPLLTYTFPEGSAVDNQKIKEEIERMQATPLQKMQAYRDVPIGTLMWAVPKPEFMLLGRSGKWPTVRQKHLDKFPTCAACGGKDQLEVHHVEPYHLFPDKELDESNLITLCDAPTRPCHRCFGHLWDWHKFNPYVRTICDHFLSTINEKKLDNIKSDVPDRYDT